MSEPTVTVVMIEDDKQIRRFVRTTLEAQGMTVIEAETGQQGLREAATRKPDLIVVDLGLPDIDGIDVIRDLRSWSEQSIIVLSARTHEDVKVAALDAGADDYLTKPFGVSELLARIRAQLRRRNRGGEQETPQVCFGGVEVDMAERRVTRDGVAGPPDADRVQVAHDAGTPCWPRADSPATVARSMGSHAHGEPALSAGLYGSSATEAGKRSRSAGPYRHRDGGGVSADGSAIAVALAAPRRVDSIFMPCA